MNLAINDKLTIVFPIEVKKRELFSKVFLSYQILKRIDCKIIIGSQRDIFNNIISIKNTIWFDKNTYFKKISTNEMLRNNIKFLLDEEGPNFFNGIYFKMRMNKKIINFFDEIFLWGKNDYDLLNNKNKKFHIFGHPKYDILKNKKFFFFKEKSHKIKKNYNDFILIASNFGLDSIIDKKIENRILQINNSDKNFLKKKELQEQIELTNYTAQINFAKKISETFPMKNIIYRPHPYQDINKVKRRFGTTSKNLKITYDDVITPWIHASKIYIHSGCSTFFEANLLEKPTIFFYKKKMNNFLTFKSYGETFNNEEAAINYLKNILDSNNISIKKKNNRLVNFVFNLKKKNFFYINFINFIKKNYLFLNSQIEYGNNKINKNYSKIIFMKILSYIKNKIILKTSLIRFLPEKYLYPSHYQLSKFDHLKKIELNKILFDLNAKFYRKMKIVGISKNVFELSLK
jgi:surface carbohydrate biosynthesis protein